MTATLREDLRRLGLYEGATVMIHASIRSTGARAEDLLDALRDTVGPFGTILVASYHYDFAKGATYDLARTPSQTGKLADVLRGRDHALRTAHPMFNFVVSGALASAFADLSGQDAFGESSPFGLLHRVSGRILLVGVDYQHGFTYVHHVEQMEGAIHRIRREFTGDLVRNGTCEHVTATAYLRAPGVETSVYAMGEALDRSGAARTGRVGNAEARLIDVRAAHEVIAAGLSSNPGFTCRVVSHVDFARELWPLPRSLTGRGVRETLAAVARRLGDLAVVDVPSGTRCFDWTVPDEWTLRTAELIAPDGSPVVSYPRDGTLAVMSYSEPIDAMFSLDELEAHLISRADRPNARPYATSYYRRDWAFCLPHVQRVGLRSGQYRARIDAELFAGSMTYGLIEYPPTPTRDAPLVLFSTNICHPSLAVNELSGLVVLTALAEYVRDLPTRHWAYRFLFVPETLGTLAVLANKPDRPNLLAGFVVSCVPDAPRFASSSRNGDTLADRLVCDLARCDRHGDDRQYTSPNINLPVVGLYDRVPLSESFREYHTSDDDLSLLSEEGFARAVAWLKQLVDRIEAVRPFVLTTCGEPQLSRHGLYPERSEATSWASTSRLRDLLDRCDGKHDLADCEGALRPLIEADLVRTR